MERDGRKLIDNALLVIIVPIYFLYFSVKHTIASVPDAVNDFKKKDDDSGGGVV